MMKGYNRTFRKGGRSYCVQDCLLRDMENCADKYYLTVLMDGAYRTVTDQLDKIPKFSSIRAAHEYTEKLE